MEKLNKIDLHTHSTASDGTDTPEQLVNLAIGHNLAALALTDHDTLGGLEEAEETARGRDLYFIRGCEISTRCELGSVHILGLWVPQDCRVLEDFLLDLRNRRRKRNEKVIEKLRGYGVNISMEEVEAIANGAVGRPHIATVLVNKGYVKDFDEAFKEFLDENAKAYVPKIVVHPSQATRILADLGATVVLAHPLIRNRPYEKIKQFVPGLAQMKLDSIEAWHSSQTAEQTEILTQLANSLDLGISGGSDYHGLNKPNIQMGMRDINTPIPSCLLENLKMRRKAKGLPV